MSDHPLYDQTIAERGFDPAAVELRPWSFPAALQQADEALWKKAKGARKARS